MSSIIKHNRINQLGTIQLGEPKKHNEHLEEAEVELEAKMLNEVSLIKSEAEKEALRILENARQEAVSILDRARDEKEILIQDVQVQLAEQKKLMEEEKIILLQTAHEKAQAIIQEANCEKKKILQEIEPEMVSIIKMLLTRIIDKQVVGKGVWLEWIVRKMIRTENITEPITVYLSEKCYEDYKGMLKDKLENFQYPIQIEVDRQLTDFSCSLETSTGSIYYDVKDGLEEVLKEVEMLKDLSE